MLINLQPIDMTSKFLGVYTALYDYDAQTEEELSIKQDDILYLLEKSETDDWWKVKKRVLDADVAEPVGLVPSTYIEPTKVQSKATAMYDYDKQTDEELSFKEGTLFDVYDTSDANWTLVGTSGGAEFGFVPANYIEIGDSGAASGEVQNLNVYGSTSALGKFPKPPQRVERDEAGSEEGSEGVGRNEERNEESEGNQRNEESKRDQRNQRNEENERDQRNERDTETASAAESEDEAPAMPRRPQNGRGVAGGESHSPEEEEEAPQMPRRPDSPSPEEFYKDDFFTWKVYEIEGKKKREAVLEIGDSQVFITPEGSSSPRSWTVRDLTNYNNEKKHVFLDFKNPAASYELHAGSKDAANAIVSILADMKGLTSMSALKDIEEASKPSHRPQGKILYDFSAVSPDELTCYEGDLVYIVNDRKSKEWWMVENIATGKKGVVPSNYIKVVGGEEAGGGSWRKLFGRKGKSATSGSSQGPRKNRKNSARGEEASAAAAAAAQENAAQEKAVQAREARLERERQELARERRRQDRRARELKTYEERQRVRLVDERERERAKRPHHGKRDLSKPNPHRVRTWIDRTGAFKVEAEFLGVQDGKIHLHKINGVKIAVAAQKLSVEDLEYVERLMGVSLDRYKVENKKDRKDKKDKKEKEEKEVAGGAESAGKKHPKDQPDKETPVSEKSYEYWFNFFLACGVDANMCEQYSRTFAREQMDDSVLEDITQPLLRTLGLKEGDVLKVMRHLDDKFDRRKSQQHSGGSQAGGTQAGGLFSGSDGSLKDNSGNPESKSEDRPQDSEKPKTSGSKFEDEAWAIRPASRAGGEEEKPAAQPQAQLTGSIQDLLDLKPMEPTKKPQAQPAEQPSVPAATPVPVKPVTTTNAAPVQPVAAQPTASSVRVPLSAMPTGFVPISMIPALTGQQTGFLPVTTFGQQPTGVLPLPQTTFGQPPATLVKLQPTGVTIQKTGSMQTGFQSMPTGFQPIQTGIQPMQTQPIQTGIQPMQTQPIQTGFQPMQTGFQPMQTQPMQTGFQPIQAQPMQTGFQPMQTQPMQTGFQPMQTQPMQTGFQPMQTQPMQMPRTSFQQPQTSFQQPQTSFQQPQTSFGVNQLTGMMASTSLASQPAQQSNQPLMAQPTGLGFGNGPQLPAQKTGRQANLANATPDNPFGF